MSDFRIILRQSIIYGLGSVATKALSIVLFPLLSHFLSVAEYGVLVRVEILWQFLFVVINTGTTIAVFNELHQAQTGEARVRVLSTMMAWYIGVGVALTLLLSALRIPLSVYLLGAEEYAPLVLIAGVVALLEMMLFVPLMELRERDRPWSYVALTSTSLLLSASGQVVAVLTFNDPLVMMYLLRLAGPVIVILAASRFVSGLYRFRIDKSIIVRVLPYSLPVLASGLMALGLGGIDRYILGILRTDHEVGLYGLGYNVGGLLNLFVIAPFLMVIHAFMWKRVAEPDGPKFFSQLMTHAVAMLCFAAVTVSLFGYSIIRTFALNPDYWGAASFVPMLTFAYVFFGMANIGMISFYLGHKTRLMMGVYATAITTNVVLNLVLIPTAGPMGASIAALAGNLVLLIMTVRLSRKAFYIRYEWKTIVMILGVAAVWIATGQYIDIQIGIVELAARFGWCVLFPVILAGMGIYGRTEWTSITSLVRTTLFSSQRAHEH